MTAERHSLAGEALMYPLSFEQRRLWFLDRLNPGDVSYNLPLAARLQGPLDVQAIRRSLEEIVRRHDVLRTRFAVVEREPVQVVEPMGTLDLSVQETAVSEEEFERLLAARARQEADTPFDLSRAPLARAALLRNGPRDAALFLTLHHTIADGWSLAVLLKEVAALYRACRARTAPTLPELAIQYGDFAVWQREQMTGATFEADLQYWKDRLRDAPVLDLPADHSLTSPHTPQGAWHSFRISAPATEALTRLGAQNGATLFMGLLAAWNVLLRAYTGQDDLCVGTAVANRELPELEPLIGFFVSTVVVRTKLAGNPTFLELLGRVRQRSLEAYAHQQVPFDRLVEELRPPRVTGRSPLFQTSLALQNTPAGQAALDGLQITPIEIPTTTAKFELSCSFTPAGRGLKAVVEYRTELFEPETIRRLAAHFLSLLDEITAHPQRRLDDLLCLPARRPVSPADAGAHATPAPEVVPLHRQIRDRALQAPDRPAILTDGAVLSYGDLSAHVTRAALTLREAGVGPGARIAIQMQSVTERTAAQLAVWSTGASFACLTGEDAGEQLDRLTAGGAVGWVLSDEAGLQKIGRQAPAPSSIGTACWLAPTRTPGGLRFACIDHRALHDRLGDFADATRVGDADLVLCEAGAEEALFALGAGATLAFPSRRDPASFPADLRQRLTIALFDGAEVEAWRQAVASGGFPALRLVVVTLPAPGTVQWRWRETTRVAWLGRLSLGAASWFGQGRARASVLNGGLGAPAHHVPGELVIGGGGLALGYLDDPAGTARSFWPDPDTTAGRLFRSGLRARCDENGSIVPLASSLVRPGAAQETSGGRRADGQPRTPIEELVLGVYADVLSPPAEGGELGLDVNASFFELGGHSLLATLVVSRLRDSLGVDVPLRAVFEAPTVAALASRVERELRGQGARAPSPIPLADRSGPLPLSNAQQRL